MTTAGREVAAASIRKRSGRMVERIRSQTVVDLRLRSNEGFKRTDHGRWKGKVVEERNDDVRKRWLLNSKKLKVEVGMEMEIEMEPSIISLAKANITTPPRRRRQKLFPVVKIKSLHQFHHHLNQNHPIPTQVVFQEPVFLCRACFFLFLSWNGWILFFS